MMSDWEIDNWQNPDDVGQWVYYKHKTGFQGIHFSRKVGDQTRDHMTFEKDGRKFHYFCAFGPAKTYSFNENEFPEIAANLKAAHQDYFKV